MQSRYLALIEIQNTKDFKQKKIIQIPFSQGSEVLGWTSRLIPNSEGIVKSTYTHPS